HPSSPHRDCRGCFCEAFTGLRETHSFTCDRRSLMSQTSTVLAPLLEASRLAQWTIQQERETDDRTIHASVGTRCRCCTLTTAGGPRRSDTARATDGGTLSQLRAGLPSCST